MSLTSHAKYNTLKIGIDNVPTDKLVVASVFLALWVDGDVSELQSMHAYMSRVSRSNCNVAGACTLIDYVSTGVRHLCAVPWRRAGAHVVRAHRLAQLRYLHVVGEGKHRCGNGVRSVHGGG